MRKLLLLAMIGGIAYTLGARKRPIAPPLPDAHDEDRLDEALEESFPASDPPSLISPHR